MCLKVVPPLGSHVPHGSIGQLTHTPSGVCVCVCVCPHIIEVKRVYDMCQHIFSSEESMCWSFIIYWLNLKKASPEPQKIDVRNRACRYVPFSETSAEIKRSSFLLYLFPISSRSWETSDPPCSILPVITKNMSCHWIQNSGMDVAATQTHRYKHTP